MSYFNLLKDVKDTSKFIRFGEDEEYKGIELFTLSFKSDSLIGDFNWVFYLQVTRKIYSIWVFDPDLGVGYEELGQFKEMPSEEIISSTILNYNSDYWSDIIEEFLEINDNVSINDFINQYVFESNYLVNINSKYEDFWKSL